MLKWILGYYRFCLAGLSIGLGGTLIVITSYIPIEIKGFRLSFWVLVATIRTILRVLNVDVDCPDKARFRKHNGFIFPNHVSYLDVLALVAVTPVRFLAKDEIRSWPVIGQIARAIGCVFVKRDDKNSRADARQALAEVETFPPVVLFPEGKRGPGDELLPFRYGAFEIVIQGESPFLPCTVTHDPHEVAIWKRGEHILTALLRLSSYGGRIHTQILALDTVQPGSDATPQELANKTREDMIRFMANNPTVGIETEAA